MKKTLLVTLEYPPFHGGIANYLFNLVKNWPTDQFAVVCSPQLGSFDFDSVQAYQVNRYPLILNYPLVWPKWIWSYGYLKRLIQKEKYEHLVISHILPLGTIGLMLKRRLNLPYTVICHGTDILTASHSARKKRLMQKIFQSASNIVANSEFTAGLIKNLGDFKSKISIITPATDFLDKATEADSASVINRYKLENKKILLTVGRLIKRKNQTAVIKAMATLNKRWPDLVYLIVGKGPYQKNLEELAQRLKVKSNVILVGAVAGRDLPDYLMAADIFINVEQADSLEVPGFGLVFLEANALGKPVIGSRVGGITEAIVEGQTGLLIDPNQQSELEKAISSLLEDKQLAHRLGEQGQQRVVNDFGWLSRSDRLKKIIS